MLKSEIFFILFILFGTAFIPIGIPELFPFSSFALFTDAPRFYVEYELYNEKGDKLSLKDYAMQRNYYGISPRRPYARVKPFSIDKFGKKVPRSLIEKTIKERMKSEENFILVKKNIFKIIDSKVQLDKVEEFKVVKEI